MRANFGGYFSGIKMCLIRREICKKDKMHFFPHTYAYYKKTVTYYGSKMYIGKPELFFSCKTLGLFGIEITFLKKGVSRILILRMPDDTITGLKRENAS